MSILQEYESIRKRIGEEAYNGLLAYLAYHPTVLLSDLYYSQFYWNACQVWLNSSASRIRNWEPLYCVVGNFRWKQDHPFYGTREEVLKTMGATDEELTEAFMKSRKDDNEDEVMFSQYTKNPNGSWSERKALADNGGVISTAVIDRYAEYGCIYSVFVCQDPEDLITFVTGKYQQNGLRNKHTSKVWTINKNMCGKKGTEIVTAILSQ